MISERFEKVKKKIRQIYLKETGTKLQLILWFLFTGITIFWVFDHINYMIREAPQNQIKIEKTGYVESIASGYRRLIITLTNGEGYSIAGRMYYSSYPFDKNEFLDEIKKGDELRLVIWQNDKLEFPYIYQLECNDNLYLSYEKAIVVVQRDNITMLIGCIFIFLFCGSFFVVALFRYVKLRLDKGRSEDVKA